MKERSIRANVPGLDVTVDVRYVLMGGGLLFIAAGLLTRANAPSVAVLLVSLALASLVVAILSVRSTRHRL